MDIKSGVKNWREGGSPNENLKASQEPGTLTQQQKEMLGADNLGSVLNKIADPNYVDPSKAPKGTGNNKMDKDAFFKLMLAQLKAQDPTNPLKNHEMAAQLAQFSSLEQMQNMNSTLNEIKGGSKPTEQFQALNLIGKKVSGDSAKVVRTELDKEHEFKFSLPENAKTAEVKVMNNKNEVVRTYQFSNLNLGENKIVWNGQNDRGVNAKAGEYKFQVEAIADSGKKLNAQTKFEGVVSGMSFTGEGPLLQVGKQNIRLKDIRQFSDPSLMSNDQNSNNITEQDLKRNDPMKQTHIKEEQKSEQQLAAAAKTTDDLLDQVGMSNELIAKMTQQMKAGAEETR